MIKLARIILALTIVGMGSSVSGKPQEAEEGVVTFRKSAGTTMNVVAYVQARVESGDRVFAAQDSKVFSSGFEAYFRRARLGFYGTAFTPRLKYGLTLAGDESAYDEIYPVFTGDRGVILADAALRYRVSDALVIKFAKGKLPYSRIYLTSSSRQLLGERPFYLYGLRSFLGTYGYTHVELNGSWKSRGLKYALAAGKPLRNGDELYEDTIVDEADAQYVARLEWSPQGWVEERRSDAHLGIGRHFALGGFYSLHDDIEGIRVQANGAGSERVVETRTFGGVDISFHSKNLTAQAEYNTWETDSTLQTKSKRAEGMYAQLGYLFPSNMWELAGRAEYVDHDVDRSNDVLRALVLGVNRYFQGHKWKVGALWERAYYEDEFDFLRDPSESDSATVRVTLQLIL